MATVEHYVGREACSGDTGGFLFSLLPASTGECRDIMKAVKTLQGSKNNNKNNHMAACRAIIKVLFSFQQDFTSRETALHLHEGMAASARPYPERGVGWRPSIDHTQPGGERHRMFRASPESSPGEFSGNRQPAATSP